MEFFSRCGCSHEPTRSRWQERTLNIFFLFFLFADCQFPDPWKILETNFRVAYQALERPGRHIFGNFRRFSNFSKSTNFLRPNARASLALEWEEDTVTMPRSLSRRFSNCENNFGVSRSPLLALRVFDHGSRTFLGLRRGQPSWTVEKRLCRELPPWIVEKLPFFGDALDASWDTVGTGSRIKYFARSN